MPRTVHEQALSLKVIGSSTPALALGHTFQAATADLSDTGVRLRLLNDVPVGADLDLWVISPLQRETLVLRGRVCWCLAAVGDATRCEAGVEISHQPTADYRKWRHMVASLQRP